INERVSAEADAFIVEEEEGLVLAVVDFWNQDRAAEGASERVGIARGYDAADRIGRIHILALEVPEAAPVELVRAVLADDGQIGGLGKFSAAGGGIDLELGDAFHRGRHVSVRTALAHQL